MGYINLENYKKVDYPHYYLLTFIEERTENDWDNPSVTWKIPENLSYYVYKENEKEKWEEQIKKYTENGSDFVAGHCDKVFKVKTTYTVE